MRHGIGHLTNAGGWSSRFLMISISSAKYMQNMLRQQVKRRNVDSRTSHSCILEILHSTICKPKNEKKNVSISICCLSPVWLSKNSCPKNTRSGLNHAAHPKVLNHKARLLAIGQESSEETSWSRCTTVGPAKSGCWLLFHAGVHSKCNPATRRNGLELGLNAQLFAQGVSEFRKLVGQDPQINFWSDLRNRLLHVLD